MSFSHPTCETVGTDEAKVELEDPTRSHVLSESHEAAEGRQPFNNNWRRRHDSMNAIIEGQDQQSFDTTIDYPK